MISFLSGKILDKGQGYIIIRVGDVGYKVYVSQTKYAELDIEQTIEFYIYQVVREDALDLYGFNNLEELEMFELLLSISGIGPKSALGVLSISNVEELKSYIAQGDPSLLTKVSGIGKKTAERVVLELRDKIKHVTRGAKHGVESSVAGDEIDALMALGYSMQQAREALKEVDSSIKDSGEKIREALKKLGK